MVWRLLLLAPLWLVSMISVAGAEGLRVLAAGQIDIVVGYCTSAKLRLSQIAELQVAEAPREIAAGPEYGLPMLKGGDPRTSDLALFMLSPDGQQIFSRYRFAPIALPAAES